MSPILDRSRRHWLCLIFAAMPIVAGLAGCTSEAMQGLYDGLREANAAYGSPAASPVSGSGTTASESYASGNGVQQSYTSNSAPQSAPPKPEQAAPVYYYYIVVNDAWTAGTHVSERFTFITDIKKVSFWDYQMPAGVGNLENEFLQNIEAQYHHRFEEKNAPMFEYFESWDKAVNDRRAKIYDANSHKRTVYVVH